MAVAVAVESVMTWPMTRPSTRASTNRGRRPDADERGAAGGEAPGPGGAARDAAGRARRARGPTRAAASRDEPRYRCSTALAAYHTGCPSRRAAGPPRTTTRAARATQPRRWWLASQRARVPHHACTRAHRPQGELGGRLRSTRVVAESSSCSVLRPRSSWSVCPWPASSLDPEFFGRNTCTVGPPSHRQQ